MSATPQERYQHKPFYGSSHRWAERLLEAQPSPARALDVGPGSGVMGTLLREKGVQRICAIEIDEAAKKHAETIYDQVQSDLSAYDGELFDLVLLLDVLEHMPAPEDFFSRLADSVTPGGIVLISVPNIAHWSVRIPLLFGFFQYTERGLLDRTHLQFFTRRRTRALAPETTFAVLDSSASIEPYEFLLPQWAWDNGIYRGLASLRLALARTLPGLFAYQHLLALRKESP